MGQRARSWRLLGLAGAVLWVAGAAGGGCLFPPEEDGFPGTILGEGGSGGIGGSGGAEPCAPGATEGCYSGPAGTEGVGPCKGGTRTCGGDGRWGPCEGETTPGEEVCGTPEDEDCDRQGWFPDSDCVCEPGVTGDCYTGPSGTLGMGPCRAGTGTCNADGMGFESCVGEVLPEEEVCGDSVLDEDCSGAPCGGDAVWALAAGGTGAQRVYDVAVDGAGNVLVAGSFENSMSVGDATIQSAGGLDAFLLRVDTHGNLLTLQRFGGVGDQHLRGVAVDGDGNVYLAGYSVRPVGINNDIEAFVSKMDAQGNALWTQNFGTNGNGDEQYANSIAVVGQGDVVIAGSFLNDIRFNSATVSSEGAPDVFLARLDTNGNHQWLRHWGDGGVQFGQSVAAGNRIFVTGGAAGNFAMDGTTIDGGASRDVLAFQHAADGSSVAWASSFGGPLDLYNQLGYDIALDAIGNVLLTGNYGGDIDFGGGGLGAFTTGAFLAKLSETGAHLWSKGFAGVDATGRGVATDSAGSVLVTGDFIGPTDFGGGDVNSSGVDLFVAKLAPDGSHRWSRAFGDGAGQVGVAVAAGPGDHALVAGHFLGQLDFGVASLSANGASLQTLFLAKLAP